MITLTAGADYGHEGKQYIARITGRDPKFTFRREFLGRKVGKRNGTTEADVDEAGLFIECDIDRKTGKNEKFRLLLELDGQLHSAYIQKEDAMVIAKRMDGGEQLAEIAQYYRDGDKIKYRILSKAEIARAVAAVTIESAVEQCWLILQALPEREAKKVLQALKTRVSPLKHTQHVGSTSSPSSEEAQPAEVKDNQ